jgi:hypothetical protein
MPRVGWQPSCGIAGSFAVESAAAFAWTGWQACYGISGSFRVEQVAALPWNRWQDSPGIGGSFGVEYAAAPGPTAALTRRDPKKASERATRITGIFLRVPLSYAAGTFCLGPCEKHQYYGKPVISAPTLPREREPSLPCTILSGGESRIRRRGYAIVSARSRRCQAERRRGDCVVREGMRDQAQGDSVWLR